MAISVLKKSVPLEKKAQEFIAQGGSLPQTQEQAYQTFNVKLPKWLVTEIDAKRRQRNGHVSRNLWITEALEKVVKKTRP